MGGFSVTTRFDSPILAGGAAPRLFDPKEHSGADVPRATPFIADVEVRGPALRGLLHTFARAIIGPLVGGSPLDTREAERRLLGAAGGDPGSGATFRLAVEVLADDTSEAPERAFFWLRPNRPSGKSARVGLLGRRAVTGLGDCRITLAQRPGCARDRQHLAALWAVTWVALSFGSIGVRARRGYGSQTIVSGGLADDVALPVFDAPPVDAEVLARTLHAGLHRARVFLRDWLESTGMSTSTSSGGSLDRFFQIGNPARIFVGTPWSDPDENASALLGDLMKACSAGLASSGSRYADVLGRIGSKGTRLASPLWVRVYRIAQRRCTAVCTYSPGDPGPDADAIRDAVLLGVGADGRTLAYFSDEAMPEASSSRGRGSVP